MILKEVKYHAQPPEIFVSACFKSHAYNLGSSFCRNRDLIFLSKQGILNK